MENHVLRALMTDDPDGSFGEPGSPISFIAATEGMKDDGLDLVMSGVQLERYRANPIFTWAHDLWGNRLPIGRVVDIQNDGRLLRIRVEFDQEDEFARQVESKYRRGFLNTVSITWNTKKRDGSKVLEWELIEIAGVPVPMDPGALMEAERAGLQSLQRSLSALFEDDAPDGSDEPESESEGEAVFLGVAVQMVRLFRGVDEFPEDERKAIYKKLARQYAELDKEAPEYVPLERIKALGVEEIRGLFLEDELDLLSGELLPVASEDDDADAEPGEADERLRSIYQALVQPDNAPKTVDPRVVEIHQKLFPMEEE